MRKRNLITMISACLMLSMSSGQVYAEDMMVPETDVASEAAPAENAAQDQPKVSSDELFELVGETMSQQGEALEDVLPQPKTAQVPATPPSASLTVETLNPHPGPVEARILYAQELLDADFKYSSDTLFYACTKHETENGFYYLTHVVIADASQIRGEDSFGDFAGIRETPRDAASRTGAKILVNGSYFNYGTGFATGGELLIRDNKVVHGPWSDGYEICLKKDGTLFSPGYNTIESVLAQDVAFSWGTCEDLLIKDGQPCTLTDFDWNGQLYPRTAIGMVRPLEYYIITAGGADHANGITIYEEQEIFASLGCFYARGLDGGGSSALVLDGEYINENGDRIDGDLLIRRPVADFLLFTE